MLKLKATYASPEELEQFVRMNAAHIIKRSHPIKNPETGLYRVYLDMKMPVRNSAKPYGDKG